MLDEAHPVARSNPSLGKVPSKVPTPPGRLSSQYCGMSECPGARLAACVRGPRVLPVFELVA